MSGDDPDFLEFFAGQFWPLRRVGFLLTGDWGLAAGPGLRPPGRLRPQGAAQPPPLAAAPGRGRGPPPPDQPPRGAPPARLRRRRPGPVAGPPAPPVPPAVGHRPALLPRPARGRGRPPPRRPGGHGQVLDPPGPGPVLVLAAAVRSRERPLPTTVPTQGWKTYGDPAGNLRFRYPPDWRVGVHLEDGQPT